MFRKQLPVLISAVLACCMILSIGTREMLSPDESRYAEIAREMLVRGDFVTPYLDGIVYFEKPVLGYWLIAGSMKLFGETAFAARFPSMLATLLTALVLMILAGKYRKNDDRIRYLAGGIFLAAPLVFFLAQIAVLDPVFSFFVTLGMVLFFPVTESPWSRKGIACQLMAGAAFGLAFLTKGFLAFALPGAALFLYYLIPGHFSELKHWSFWKRALCAWFTLEWLPAIAALAVILPWAAAIHHAQPAYWHYFIVEEHFQRFMKPNQHPAPVWFFVPVLAGGLGYLLFCIVNVWNGLKGKVMSTPLLRYAFLWFLGPFLFLSASTGKLGTYVLPCFPPLALLFAAGLYHQTEEQAKYRVLNVFLLILGIAGSIAVFCFLLPAVWKNNPLFSGVFAGRAVIVSGLVLVFAFGSFAAFRAKELRKKLAVMGIALLPFILFWGHCLPRFVVESRAPSAMIRRSVSELNITPETMVMSFCYPVQSVCWELKRDDVYLFERAGEVDYGLDLEKKRGVRFMRAKEAAVFLASPGRPADVVIYMPNSLAREYEKLLPVPRKVVRDTDWKKSYCALLF